MGENGTEWPEGSELSSRATAMLSALIQTWASSHDICVPVVGKSRFITVQTEIGGPCRLALPTPHVHTPWLNVGTGSSYHKVWFPEAKAFESILVQ